MKHRSSLLQVLTILILIFLSGSQALSNDQMGNDQTKIDSLLSKCQRLKVSDPQEGIRIAEFVLTLCDHDSLNLQRASAHQILCISHYNLGEYDTALVNAKNQEEICRNINDSLRWIGALINLGICFDNQGHLDSAIHVYSEALKLSETSHPDKIASIKSNLAAVYADLGDNETARNYSKSALEIATSNNDSIWTFVLNQNLGTGYLRDGEYEKAEKHFENGLRYCPFKNYDYFHSLYLKNMGLLYMELQEFSKAKGFLRKSEKIYDKQKNHLGLAEVYFWLGKIAWNDNKDSAFYYANKSNDLSIRIKSIEREQNSSSFLHELCLHKGDTSRAFVFLQRSHQLEDSLKNDENQRVAIRHQIELENEKIRLQKENESALAIKKKELEKRKDRTLFVSIFFTIVVISLLYWRNQKVKIKEEKRLLIEKINFYQEQLDKRESNLHEKIKLQLENIPESIKNKLNETDIKILKILILNPLEPNTNIASQVFRSKEGVTSSLRKMYKLFELPDSRNKKVSLVLQVSRMATESPLNYNS